LSAEELARRAQEGCRASFAYLVDRYAMSLLRFLHRRTGNLQDAEDLVQDTFVRAYANIDRYQSSYKFSTWLFTIARRLATSRLRSRRRPRPLIEAETCSPEPDVLVSQQETRQNLWAAAETLSVGQYEALWLRYGRDMPIKEIARVMGRSQVGVRVLLCRARTALAARLRNMAAEALPAEKGSPEETLAYMKVEGA